MLEIVGARGARLILADGREVLDAISSWWCKSLGHGHAGVRARIEKQLARFEHIIAANTTHQALVELCERLLVMANTAHRGGDGHGQVSSSGARSDGVAAWPDRGGHFGKVFLADNGSTAVEVAMKMALQAQAQRGQTGRTRFAALAGGYHGETIATLSAGDLGLYADPYRPLMFPVHKLTPIPYRVGSHDPAWQDAAPEWEAIERSLAPNAGELAAIIYEPVLQAAGGMRLYSPDLLRRLRKFADQHSVFLIADEIAAGMGRLGTMLASRLADQPPARPAATGADASEPPSSPAAATLPDFAVFSKGLTAGFLPLSAVLTTDAIYQHFYGAWSDRLAFLHSNTYTANALAVAAALGALDAYDNEGVLAAVNTEGPRLLHSLTEVARTSRVLTGVRGLGMVAAVDLCAPDGRPFEASARMGRQVFREAVKRGALLRPLGDTLYLFPPLNTPAGELDAMVDILAASVAAVVPGG